MNIPSVMETTKQITNTKTNYKSIAQLGTLDSLSKFHEVCKITNLWASISGLLRQLSSQLLTEGCGKTV